MLSGMRQASAGLGVGCVIAVAVDQLGLAGVSKSHVLARNLTTDLTGVGLDAAPLQTGTIADTRISVAHLIVILSERLLRGMEAVGVVHDKLTAAHKAKARTDFVAELDLRLIQRRRQLFVRTKLGANQGGDDLLVRGAKAELVAMTVGDAGKLGAVVVPTTGLMPQIARLNERQQDLLSARGLNLFVDDGGDLVQDAHAQRQERVQARTHLANVAGAKHQPMTGKLGTVRVFLERGSVELAHAQDVGHRRLLFDYR